MIIEQVRTVDMVQAEQAERTRLLAEYQANGGTVHGGSISDRGSLFLKGLELRPVATNGAWNVWCKSGYGVLSLLPGSSTGDYNTDLATAKSLLSGRPASYYTQRDKARLERHKRTRVDQLQFKGTTAARTPKRDKLMAEIANRATEILIVQQSESAIAQGMSDTLTPLDWTDAVTQAVLADTRLRAKQRDTVLDGAVVPHTVESGPMAGYQPGVLPEEWRKTASTLSHTGQYVLASLTTRFGSGFSSAQYKRSKLELNSRIIKSAEQWDSLPYAQRSKNNPYARVGTVSAHCAHDNANTLRTAVAGMERLVKIELCERRIVEARELIADLQGNDSKQKQSRLDAAERKLTRAELMLAGLREPEPERAYTYRKHGIRRISPVVTVDNRVKPAGASSKSVTREYTLLRPVQYQVHYADGPYMFWIDDSKCSYTPIALV